MAVGTGVGTAVVKTVDEEEEVAATDDGTTTLGYDSKTETGRIVQY